MKGNNMGMYTELAINVSLKKNTPEDLINAIKYLMGQDYKEFKKDHALFSCERAEFICKCDSYYFQGTVAEKFIYDEGSENWNLLIWHNLKNYDNEIEEFLDFIAPWIDPDNTCPCIGHTRYEEDEYITLIYSAYGSIRYKRVSLNTES
jgi:hypothetical protein